MQSYVGSKGATRGDSATILPPTPVPSALLKSQGRGTISENFAPAISFWTSAQQRE
jgi:hypothetical protein